MTQVTDYPHGPLSLVQLDYWTTTFDRYPHAQVRIGEDAYDYGVRRVGEAGIYPTFGHIDVRTRRWYRDLFAQVGEIGIPIQS